MKALLKNLGIESCNSGYSDGRKFLDCAAEVLPSYSPVDGQLIAEVKLPATAQCLSAIEMAADAFIGWRNIPAPQRGAVVRCYGEMLRQYKQDLGRLVSYEMGKSLQEGLGEVQEMIDICDFAVGLSRQLCGQTMHSERPGHRMYEQWHPLGVVGMITAFNFPVAVWSWNAMIALVCGNTCIWKPSEKTPLTAQACFHLLHIVFNKLEVPAGVCVLLQGDYKTGELLSLSKQVALISATGSTNMGRVVGKTLSKRFGKCLLELGGNNAMIITSKADMEVTLPAAVFGAIGTAGQRCTTTRRLIVHEDIYDDFIKRLVAAYGKLNIGSPLLPDSHLGPLIDKKSVAMYCRALEQVVCQGGRFLVEGGVLEAGIYRSGCYVKPCIAEVPGNIPIVQQETFAPILYVMKYATLQDAIALQNGVPQGLSSAIMTTDIREAELFLSQNGSDAGIANVNIGTSGAEIGGAFGGEKETGGGRESGSDAWKSYMRRQTVTINYSGSLPLAQGIDFRL